MTRRPIAWLLALLLLAAAPAVAGAQGASDQAGQGEGPSMFTVVSLMLLAAGTGAMAASLVRGRARARNRAQPAATERTAPAKPPDPSPRRAAEPAPAARQAPSWQQPCRIGLWQGYANKQFFAEVPGGGPWIAQSPLFRVEQGHTVDDSKQAAHAFDTLVDELVADGWEITGRRGRWQLYLRRTGAQRPPARLRAE